MNKCGKTSKFHSRRSRSWNKVAESEGEVDVKKSEREGETKMDPPQSESKGKGAATLGVYSRVKPPEDDCCPICFDDFRFTCRTSCGHWFCSSCILMYWRHSANFKPCKCPICGQLIKNLSPEPSLMILRGEEVTQVLKDMEKYNNLNNGGWSGFFVKAVALPLLIRRRLRESPNPLILDYVFSSLHLTGLLLGILYKVYDCSFFPYGGLGIALFFDMCGQALVLLLLLDVIWHRWITRRRLGV